MATRTTTITTCDIHNGDHDATHTVKYSVNGRDYEVDLCDDGVRDYDAAINPWMSASRLVSQGTRKRGAARLPSGESTTGLDLKAVRTWASNNGIEVSQRGRVPQAVVDRYREATGS